MKNLLKNLSAFHLSRHRQRRDMVHRLGSSLLSAHRGRTMMVLGGLAFLAEMWRRKHHSSEEFPQLAE